MKINHLSSAQLLKLLQEQKPHQQHQLYVRDEEYGWLPANFLERDETLLDRVKVQICIPKDWLDTTVSTLKDYSLLNKCKKWVAQDDVVVLPFVSASSSGSASRHHAAAAAAHVRDVLQLDTLHEASLLYLLKQRFSQKLYYTRMGSILLSFNNNSMMQDHDDDTSDVQRSYAKSFVWQGA
jgi:hypothetical protein